MSERQRYGLYQRDLPCPPSIASLDSDEGQHIFAKAMSDGTAKCFFGLVQQYRTQDEPSYCGISTLVMVLNSLRVDPGRIWKGPWRWVGFGFH